MSPPTNQSPYQQPQTNPQYTGYTSPPPQNVYNPPPSQYPQQNPYDTPQNYPIMQTSHNVSQNTNSMTQTQSVQFSGPFPGNNYSVSYTETHSYNTGGPSPHFQHQHAPMDYNSFNDFKKRVKDTAFSSAKVDLVSTVAKNSYFTSEQVKELIKESLVHSSDKISAVDILYPRTVDPTNFLVVEDAMVHMSEKEKVRDVMKGGNNVHKPIVSNDPFMQSPMDPNSFSDFKKRLSNTSFSSAKVDLIRTIAQSSWFTSNQVKELVKDGLVHSSDKTEAAEILYPRVLDKNNFLVVEDAMVHMSDKEKVRNIMKKGY